MKKYRVIGETTVVVEKEVWACNAEHALAVASVRLDSLTSFCGNGGYDKLIGVYEHDESVDAPESIEWKDTEFIEEDPDYFECPDCDVECEMKIDAEGIYYWECPDCGTCYDTDGYEFWPAEEDEDE